MSYFRLEERNTNVRTEVLAGCTTFLTMSYIIFVNPLVLAGTGMDTGAVLVATCLAAAFGCAVMGLYANYPIALAPGMGLNAYFAAVAVGTLGLSWQAALGAVFCSGVLMLVLSVLPVREWVVNSIPRSQKMAIAAGIGFFLVIIGLRNAGVVVANEATLVGLGNLAQWTVALAALGFMGIVALEHRKIPGAVVICILAAAAAGWLGGAVAGARIRRLGTPFAGAVSAAAGHRRCARGGPDRHRVRIPDGGPVRHQRHPGRRAQRGRTDRQRRARSPAAPGPRGGQLRHHGGRSARYLDHDVLYRERRGGAGGRPDRAHRPGRGRAFHCCAPVRAGRDRDSGIRYRTG